MKKYDVVYILKRDVAPEELRYSLRSVEANLPHNQVWFYGGCPMGIKPDHHVNFTQHGLTTWDKVSDTIKNVCRNGDITDDFWLFNDDFFILKKMTNTKPLVQGSLAYRVQRIKEQHNGDSAYSNELRKVMATMKHYNCDRLDYALHVPMLINKRKALKVLNQFPHLPMFRSLYGNYWHIGGELMDDVKIFDNDTTPGKDWRFCSTTDGSFKEGAVGDYIRSMFKDKGAHEYE